MKIDVAINMHGDSLSAEDQYPYNAIYIKNRTRDGSLWAQEITGLATSHFNMFTRPLFPVAPQDPVGEKSTVYYAIAA